MGLPGLRIPLARAHGRNLTHGRGVGRWSGLNLGFARLGDLASLTPAVAPVTQTTPASGDAATEANGAASSDATDEGVTASTPTGAPPTGTSPGPLFLRWGAALFRRCRHLGLDEPAARVATQVLFTRLVVHARAVADDPVAAWRWVYRVATTHSLRQLADTASVDGLPPMRQLRALDEAALTTVVLARGDGLGPDELAAVLGTSRADAQRALARASAVLKAPVLADADADAHAQAPAHPSNLALDATPEATAAHVADCARCQAYRATAIERDEHFERDVAPALRDQVLASIRAERAAYARGPGWRKALMMLGVAVVIAAVALVVTRPPVPRREDVPYAGDKGASRAKGAGLQILVRRQARIEALKPGEAVHPGDELRFRLRSDRSRYLELRVRTRDGDRRIFPTEGERAAVVPPGKFVTAAYVVPPDLVAGAGSGKGLWLAAFFADHPFPLDVTPGGDVEVIASRVDVEPRTE